MQYRAWGALKHSDFGNGTGVTLGYDGRGMMSSYSLSGVKDPGTGAVRPEGSDVQHYADGLVRFASDYLSDAQGFGIQDRAYQYDQAGRLKEAYSGTDARNIINGVSSNVGDGPYRQSYSYDEWGNQTSRTGRYWSQDDIDSESYTPQTNRNPAWSYDADGRLVSRNEESPNGLTYVPAHYSFDAAGRRAQMTQTTSRPNPNPHINTIITTAVTQADTYDGDGLGVERAVTKQAGGGTPSTAATYYLRSTVLGGRVVAQYNSSGARQSSYAWAGGDVLAEQTGVDIGMPQLRWEHLNPATGDGRETDTSGRAVRATHLDPAGVDVGDSDPFSSGSVGDPTEGGMSQSAIDSMVASLMPGWGGRQQCAVDGLLTGCGFALSLEAGGAADRCGEDDDCGTDRITTIIAKDKDGNVISSTTVIRLPGQPGWDGSLDGTYQLTPAFGAQFDTDTAAGASSFLNFLSAGPSLYGDSFYTELVQKSGTPPKPPTLKNATPEQQSRFTAAFNELWRRLHEKDGKNPCAELFGGITNAEKALRDTHFSVGTLDDPDAGAETKGRNIKIDPNHGFFDTSSSISIQVGVIPKEHARINELPYIPVTITLGNVEMAAFYLLHELGHRTDTLPDDGGSGLGMQSILNNGKIQKACFPEAETH
jgi:hypothetical protein